MGDVVFIAALLAFFAICALYVQACDRMIGPDDVTAVDPGADADVATSATVTT